MCGSICLWKSKKCQSVQPKCWVLFLSVCIFVCLDINIWLMLLLTLTMRKCSFSYIFIPLVTEKNEKQDLILRFINNEESSVPKIWEFDIKNYSCNQITLSYIVWLPSNNELWRYHQKSFIFICIYISINKLKLCICHQILNRYVIYFIPRIQFNNTF